MCLHHWLRPLGSFQAEALARAGIGRLRLIDRDYVDYTNLQRQWLFSEADAQNESPKSIAAARRLHDLNHHVEVQPLVADLSPSNAEELTEGCDLILDGTDNFETRYLLNDLSVKRIPRGFMARPLAVMALSLSFTRESDGVSPRYTRSRLPDLSLRVMSAACWRRQQRLVAALQVAAALRLLVGSPGLMPHPELDVWEKYKQQHMPLAVAIRMPGVRIT